MPPFLFQGMPCQALFPSSVCLLLMERASRYPFRDRRMRSSCRRMTVARCCDALLSSGLTTRIFLTLWLFRSRCNPRGRCAGADTGVAVFRRGRNPDCGARASDACRDALAWRHGDATGGDSGAGKRTSAARARARVGVDAVRIWISGDPIAAGITCQKEPSTVDGSAPLRAPTSSAPLLPAPHVRQPVALRQDVHRHSA